MSHLSPTTWKVARALFWGPGTTRELAARANVRKEVVQSRLWRLQRLGWIQGQRLEPTIKRRGGDWAKGWDGWWSKRWWLTPKGFEAVRPTYRRTRERTA